MQIENRHRLAAGFVVLLVAASLTHARQDAGDSEVDARWLERLNTVDRGLLDDLIGYAPPAFRSDLAWPGGEAMTWENLTGKVVVIQSWSGKSTKGRTAPLRAARALEKQLASEDVVMIALHTPEGADNAETFLERREMPVPVAVDAAGAFCDDLGIYQQPTNIIVDRNGVVRFAGLKADALPRAVDQLVGEDHDPSKTPPARDNAEARRVAETAFPSFSGTVSNAADFRGRPAPEFAVHEWITERPNAKGKVVVVDFWATWCPPCIKSIPHMNELANTYRNDVVCIGVSDEQSNAFYNGMRQVKLTTSDFAYPLALDPQGRMKGALRITAIPHCIVFSGDGIVRWQGHPASLRKETLGQIVKANQILQGTNRVRRWGTSG